jgi:hypothetical protein
MSYKLVALQIRAEKALEARLQDRKTRGEAGQGALEYVGMILIAALVIGGVWAAVKAAGLDAKITAAITKILGG